MNFISSKGCFGKKSDFQKIWPKWLEIAKKYHFAGHFLVMYAVLDLEKEQYYQIEMAIKPTDFL